MKQYKKYFRIAVIIRGQKRIWDYVKHNHFFYHERIAEHVDYYFVTWASPTNDSEGIKKSFEGRNLVKLLELTPNKDIYGAWFAPAWMCYSIVPYLEEREKTVKYDAVFDQRTDTVIWIQADPFEVKPMTMYTPGPEFNNTGPETKAKGTWGVTDYGCMSDSETYKLLATRFNDPHDNRGYESPEWHLAVFCNDRNIAMPGGSVMNMIAVRPDICKDFEHPITQIDTLISRFNRSHPNWVATTLKEKMQIFKDYNININEYQDVKFGYIEQLIERQDYAAMQTFGSFKINDSLNFEHIYVFDTDFNTTDNNIENLEWRKLENLDWNTSVPYYLPNGDQWASWTPDWCLDLKNLVDSKFFEINPNSKVDLYQIFIHDMTTDSKPNKNIHRDWPMFNTWSAVAMLKGGGGLNFYEKYDDDTLKHTVDFKPGRIIIFPSIYWHRVDSVPESRLSVGFLYSSSDLVPSMANVLPRCDCKLKLTQIICDGSHSSLK